MFDPISQNTYKYISHTEVYNVCPEQKVFRDLLLDKEPEL